MAYPAATKAKALQLYRRGHSWFSVCHSCNVSRGTLFAWLHEAKQPLQTDPAFKIERPFESELAAAIKELQDNGAITGKIMIDREAGKSGR